jgi:hypothetical protein
MKMNDFVLGTNDMRASKAFYGAVFEEAGLQSLSPSGRMKPTISRAIAVMTTTSAFPAATRWR